MAKNQNNKETMDTPKTEVANKNEQVKNSKQNNKNVKNKNNKKESKLAQGVRGMGSEIKKITWPSFKTVVKQTGVVLTAVGVYDPLVKWAGAGATVPLTGFGYTLAQGVKRAVDEDGVVGIITGGVTAAAGGITAAIVFGYVAALLSKPRGKG